MHPSPQEPRPISTQRSGKSGTHLAEQLRNEIFRGTLTPGERITQEDLADRYHVSRVPVREAIRILEIEGLVTVVPNAGTWVSHLTLAECEEIYRMRERLEPLLLRYSMANIGEQDVMELRALADDLHQPGLSTEDFMRLDRAFHLATYAQAHTLQLGDLIANLWNTTAPYRRAFISSWSDASRHIANSEHSMIIAAIEDQDPVAAERVLANHIRRTRRMLKQHSELFAQAA